MAEKPELYTLVPMEERQEEENLRQSTADGDHVEELEERFDKDFWLTVQGKVKAENLSWNRAMDEVRVDRLIEKHGKNAPLVVICDWPEWKKYKVKPELLPSLEYLISRLTEIMLRRDTNEDYKYFRVSASDKSIRPTLLHLAAERNFLHVTKSLVEHYPGLMYIKTHDKPGYLPAELALMKYKDETAAYLISQMRHDRVHKLFLCQDDDEQSPTRFYFGNYISCKKPASKEPAMKKTVIAVLDKLINPHWPYLPERQDNGDNEDYVERAFNSVPDDPMNFDFFYHTLESDENGREPKIDVAVSVDESGRATRTKKIVNPLFNRKSQSCLRRIAESGNLGAIQHPVVRMLVSRKWNNFARTWFSIQATFYVLFLTVLSYALIYGSTRDDPAQYSGKADGLRLFCEICTILFLMFYFFEEINQAEREWRTYFTDPYNYFDWLGLILTFLVIPFRFTGAQSQWSLAALGYLFHFLRLFKFSCVTRTTGLYTKTLAKIIYRDVTRFSVVFLIVFLGFCGAMFMALKAAGSQELFSGYQWLMLAAIRALVEQQPAEEDYAKFSWLAIIVLLVYMAMVIVVLLNILIAQLSDTYSQAKKTAKLQYAIDTMRIVTRLEYSRFASWNLRVKNYMDGDWVREEELAKEILEDTDERHPLETIEERLTDIREREIWKSLTEVMRKVVRQNKESQPQESVYEKLASLTRMIEDLTAPKKDTA